MVMGSFYLFERPIEPNILLYQCLFGAIIGGSLPLLRSCTTLSLVELLSEATGYSSHTPVITQWCNL